MSGPKVIGVESLRAIQEREAVRTLHRIHSCVMDLAASDISEEQKERLHKHLQSLLTTIGEMRQRENWKEIIGHGEAQLEFFSAELQEALEQQRKLEAEQVQQSQNVKFALATAIAECQRLRIAVPAELVRASKGAVVLADVSELLRGTLQEIENIKAKQTLEASMNLLQQHASEFNTRSDIPTRIRDIIQGLADGDSTVQKVTSLLKDAVKWARKEQLAALQKNADAIAAETDDHRRELLVDSFAILVSEERTKVAEESRCYQLIRKMEELLAPFTGNQSEQWLNRIEAVKRVGSYEACLSLHQEVESWVKAQEMKVDAEARRAAVLSGLASLGYEFREGMAVGQPAEGIIVVEKASIPGYGIEVTSPATHQSMQVRVVAFRDQTDATAKLRDKEVEEKWCTEFQKLKKYLESHGFSVALKHASAAGEYPVKAVGTRSKSPGSSVRNDNKRKTSF